MEPEHYVNRGCKIRGPFMLNFQQYKSFVRDSQMISTIIAAQLDNGGKSLFQAGGKAPNLRLDSTTEFELVKKGEPGSSDVYKRFFETTQTLADKPDGKSRIDMTNCQGLFHFDSEAKLAIDRADGNKIDGTINFDSPFWPGRGQSFVMKSGGLTTNVGFSWHVCEPTKFDAETRDSSNKIVQRAHGEFDEDGTGRRALKIEFQDPDGHVLGHSSSRYLQRDLDEAQVVTRFSG